MGRRAEIELTAEEREVLERWARRPKSARRWQLTGIGARPRPLTEILVEVAEGRSVLVYV